MYLDQFVASGTLDADGAERLCWEAAKYSARIVLVVDGRRVMPQNLPLCWDALRIKPGTTVAVEVSGASRASDADQQQAIAGFVDTFTQVLDESPGTVADERPRSHGAERFRRLFRRGSP